MGLPDLNHFFVLNSCMHSFTSEMGVGGGHGKGERGTLSERSRYANMYTYTYRYTHTSLGMH